MSVRTCHAHPPRHTSQVFSLHCCPVTGLGAGSGNTVVLNVPVVHLEKRDVKLFLSFLSLGPPIHTHAHACTLTHMHARTLLFEIAGSAGRLEAAYLSQAPSTFSVLLISLSTPLLPKANRILRQSNLKIETFTNTFFQILFLKHILAF